MLFFCPQQGANEIVFLKKIKNYVGKVKFDSFLDHLLDLYSHTIDCTSR